MRFRELLQLVGLGRPIKFYPVDFQTIELSANRIWKYPRWRVPKPTPAPDFEQELKFYGKFLTEGDFAIDVGAHIGDTTAAVGLLCGKKGGVIAFEPNPITFQILCMMALFNRGWSNIIPIPLAASRYKADTIFEYGDHWLDNGGCHYGTSQWSHGSAYKVPVKCVDLIEMLEDIFPELISKVKFIKLDCEGMDLIILPSIFNRFKLLGCSFQWEMKDDSASSQIIDEIFRDSDHKLYIRDGFNLSRWAGRKYTGSIIDVIASTSIIDCG